MSGAKSYLLIPTYDLYSEAKQDLQDLLTSLRLGSYSTYFRIVVLLDSCSRIFQTEFESKFGDIAEFWNHSGNPLNFTANVNRGLRKARKEKAGALIVNQDCILPNVEHILKHMVGAQFSSSHTIDLPNKPLEEVVSLLNELSNVDVGNIPVQKLPGWKVAGYCFWLGAQTLQEIGLLPEHLLKASFDDDHITALALLAGKTVELTQARVYHKGSHIDQTKTGQSRSGAYGLTDNSLELHRFKFCEYWKIPNGVAPDQYIKWIVSNYEWTPELRKQVITE